MKIKWSDIAAECGSYKDGFVSVFRKYEGMDTDKIVRGKTVKVTQKSFADYMHIPHQTFYKWVQAAVDPTYNSKAAKQQRTAASHAAVVKNLAKTNPRALVDAIELAGGRAADEVFDEQTLRRHGADTSPAHAKAAQAHVHAATAPIRQVVLTDNFVELCVAALVEAKDCLEEAQDNGTITSRTMKRIAKANEDFQIALAEVSLALS